MPTHEDHQNAFRDRVLDPEHAFVTGWVHALLTDDDLRAVKPHIIRRCLIQELQLHAPFVRIQPARVFDWFAQELVRIRYTELRELVTTYIPEALWKPHNLLPWHGKRHDQYADPVVVFREAYATSDTTEGRKIVFEAGRDLSLAELSLQLVTERGELSHSGMPKWSETGKTWDDRKLMVEHLRQNHLIRDVFQSVVLLSEHAFEAPHRCVFVRTGEEEHIFPPEDTIDLVSLPITIRHRLGMADRMVLCNKSREVPAYMVVRRKGIIQTIAKALSLDQGRTSIIPLHVPDRIGIRFLFRSHNEFLWGAGIVRKKLCHGIMRKYQSGEGDAVNEFAYSGLVLAKDGGIMQLREIEVQCMPIEHHANIMWSKGPEHTSLYHLRSYLDPDRGILPRLFPERHYGIDWQDERIQERMKQHILTKI